MKNFNCKLVKELKKYHSDSRLILTGTPLQNNLAELWSLLNFLVPDAFTDLEHFESMFDFSDIKDEDGHEKFIQEKKKTVSTLHAILKPFLLRRVKGDVENLLPKKREYILYAPLTPVQKELYRKIKDGEIREYLEEKALERLSANRIKSLNETPKGVKRKRQVDEQDCQPKKNIKSFFTPMPSNQTPSRRRGVKSRSYAEVSDEEYFKKVVESSESEEIDQMEQEEKERLKNVALASKKIHPRSPQHFADASTRKGSFPQETTKYRHATPPRLQHPAPLFLALVHRLRNRLDSNHCLRQNFSPRTSCPSSPLLRPQNHHLLSVLQTTRHPSRLGQHPTFLALFPYRRLRQIRRPPVPN